uniref:Uncharacterized protein n=1 Tax=Grammatophora oceanica TaxID=210454 RepID=A0A7S1YCG3_9STRA
MASLSVLALIMGSDLSLSEDEDGNTIAPEGAPSITFLSLSLLGFGTGFWMADVMGDSIVAEKAKFEVEKGHIQATCYSCRFFGLMVASPFSTVLYSWLGPKSIVMLLVIIPLTILPLLLYLNEQRLQTVKPTSEQCGEIWNTVCSRAVWQPMGFVYLYNVLQVGNAAWKQFLRTVLGFTAIQLNSFQVLANVLLFVGVLAYKYYFIAYSWRSVYISTTLLNGLFSALQVCLITGTTFGIPNYWFALGDDAFADFIGGIQFLPTTIMMVHLCPAGSEGASYAMFTTVNNAAMSLSGAISTMILGIWDVSKEAFENNELQGMIKLTVFTTIVQTSGVLFVGLLPRTKEDLAKLHQGEGGRSRTGGFIFLAVTFFSLGYALVVGALNIVAPGWAGES